MEGKLSNSQQRVRKEVGCCLWEERVSLGDGAWIVLFHALLRVELSINSIFSSVGMEGKSSNSQQRVTNGMGCCL